MLVTATLQMHGIHSTEVVGEGSSKNSIAGMAWNSHGRIHGMLWWHNKK
jgi:hypothetical protein